MKYRLVHAEYFPEERTSEAIIDTMHGLFYGVAHCHPEEEYESHFAGCRIAESRAILRAVQFEKNILNHQIKELEDFEKILKSLKEYNHHSVECRRLRRRIHELKDIRKEYIKQIKAIKEGITKTMDERDAFLAKTK